MNPAQPVKMLPVDAETFESIGYVGSTRSLYIKFRNSPTLCFNDIPAFRYSGLMAAPRKDAYFRSFIKDRFLAKEVPPPGA